MVVSSDLGIVALPSMQSRDGENRTDTAALMAGDGSLKK